MIEVDGEKARVRYRKIQRGSNKGKMTGCLVTIEKHPYVYFGMSKCSRSQVDRFTKQEGRSLAANRALKALDQSYTTRERDKHHHLEAFFDNEETGTVNVKSHHAYYGRVHINNVKSLIRYFKRHYR